MAVFLTNNCTFNGCGLTFPTLRELIQHIEDTHIDNDPRLLEKHELQPPSCLPVSYILRVFTDVSRGESLGPIRKRQRALSPASSVCSNTPTGSEMDEEEMSSESDNSNDSWTTQNEFISEYILRMMNTVASSEDKPFACPVPGCKKRYKNVNGIKYHAKNGHKKEAKVRKAHKCHCGKSYKTSHGLKTHTVNHHSMPTLTTQGSSEVTTTNSSTAAVSKNSDLISAIVVSKAANTPPASTALMQPTNHHMQTDGTKSVGNSFTSPAIKTFSVVSPTLQHHLLSPVIAPVKSSLASVIPQQKSLPSPKEIHTTVGFG